MSDPDRPVIADAIDVHQVLVDWSDWVRGYELCRRHDSVVEAFAAGRRSEDECGRKTRAVDEHMTVRLEAVEKAVAHLQFLKDFRIKQLIVAYYVAGKDVVRIAEEIQVRPSEARNLLRYALRVLVFQIPEWEKRIAEEQPA